MQNLFIYCDFQTDSLEYEGFIKFLFPFLKSTYRLNRIQFVRMNITTELIDIIIDNNNGLEHLYFYECDFVDTTTPNDLVNGYHVISRMDYTSA